jgi:hypothetical protein
MGLMTDTNSITSKNTISNKEQVSHPDHVALIKEPTTSKNYNTETEYDDDYDDDFDFAQLRLSTEKIHRDYDPKTIVNDSEYPQFNENAFFKQFLDPCRKQFSKVREFEETILHQRVVDDEEFEEYQRSADRLIAAYYRLSKLTDRLRSHLSKKSTSQTNRSPLHRFPYPLLRWYL